MKITKIECHVLLVPEYSSDACSSAQDDIVVLVHTDEGITGIGEVDTNPWAAKALIEAPGTHCMGYGLTEMLMGQDPLQPEALWQKLYVGSAMTGRRGLGICAIGALDMALWDIRGKAMGVPCWQLLGGAVQKSLTPYASLLPNGKSVDAHREGLIEKGLAARQAGFRAMKMEVCLRGPYAHNGVQEDDKAIIDTVAACREALGDEITMMVDVAYAWPDAKAALRVMKELEPFDIYFLETPLPIDDLDGYAYLSDHSPIRVAAGEWQNTRFEFHDLIDRGHIDVAQPDIGRVGGLTEARRVADFAGDRGRLIVPHCWKTGIGIAASAQLAVATGHCPYIEYLPAKLSDSVLRDELADDGLVMTQGQIALPDKPGLGVELNPESLAKYSVNGRDAKKSMKIAG